MTDLNIELKHELLYETQEETKRSAPTEVETILVPISAIHVEKGRRKDFGNIAALSQDINQLGLLNPPVVRPIDDGKYELVAGERRFRAIMLLGWDTIPVTLKQDFTNDLLSKLAELSENVNRKDYDPLEEAEIIRQIDEIKRRQHGDGGQGQGANSTAWNIKKTSAFVGTSEDTIRRQLRLANAVKENPELKAKLQGLGVTVALRKLDHIQSTDRLGGQLARGELTVSGAVLLGSCIDLIKQLPNDSQDLWLTDPPFGLEEIESTRGRTKGDSAAYTAMLTESDNSSLGSIKEVLTQLVPEIVRVLRPSAHFYVFTSGELLLWLVPELQKAGLEINENVLIWDKGKTTTPFKGLEYPSIYEPVIFGHKPPRSKHLNDPKCSNILRFPALHSTKKVHPFQKPTDLVAYLIKNSTKEGDNVLDTFAGSGVFVRVAHELNRNGLGFELDKTNWMRSQIILEHGVARASEMLKSE